MGSVSIHYLEIFQNKHTPTSEIKMHENGLCLDTKEGKNTYRQPPKIPTVQCPPPKIPTVHLQKYLLSTSKNKLYTSKNTYFLHSKRLNKVKGPSF